MSIVPANRAQLNFGNNTFDFVFSDDRGLERSVECFEFRKEIARTLKLEGFEVFHVKDKDDYSYNSFVDLFKFCCKVLKFNNIQGFDESMPVKIFIDTNQTNSSIYKFHKLDSSFRFVSTHPPMRKFHIHFSNDARI